MTLLEEAQKLIQAHLIANPRLSILGITRSAGLPASTGRGIITGEVSKTTPDKILALLTTIMPYAEARKIVDKHESASLWQGGYGQRPSDTVAVLADSEIRQSFDWEHPDPFILAWASLSSGVSLDLLVKRYGEEGRRRASALLSAGILREVNGRLKEQAEFNLYLDPSDSVKKARLHANHWNCSDEFSEDILYHLTQNLSLEGFELARKSLKNCLQELLEIGADHKGCDRVFMLSLIGSIMKENQL